MNTNELIQRIDKLIADTSAANIEGYTGMFPRWLKGLSPQRMLALAERYGARVTVISGEFGVEISSGDLCVHASGNVIPRGDEKDAMSLLRAAATLQEEVEDFDVEEHIGRIELEEAARLDGIEEEQGIKDAHEAGTPGY